MPLASRRSLLRLIARLIFTLSLLSGGPAAWAQAQPAPVILTDQQPRVDLWPSVTVLSDPEHRFTWQQVLAPSKRFEAPTGLYANLGPRAETVWLRIPVQMPALGSDGLWWLAIDYPPLDVAELLVVSGGQLVQRALMGDHLLMANRPARTLVHAAALTLEAGRTYELLIRVRSISASALIVPVALVKAPELLRSESAQHLLQGLALGFGLCLLVFTASRAFFTRELMYLWFTLVTLSSTLFYLSYCGLGALHFWPGHAWLTVNTPPLALLLILATGSLFVDRALDMPRFSPRASHAMHALSGVAVLSAALFIAGVLNYRQASHVATAIGLLPMLLAWPVAFRRARAGDRASRWTFVGWSVYAVGVASFVALNLGKMPATPGTIAIYQISSILETVAWIMVLNLRAKEFRIAAEHTRREHDRVLQISQTDPLTGLLNRRGLQLGLPPLVQAAANGRLTAVYLLDLDGFKPINDTHGHDAGDEVLKLMGERLKAAVRGGDLVARLGGDEFVVVASQLRGEAEAEQVGQKLLACSASDFSLARAQCRVGMTVGYAIAPLDGTECDALLRSADGAMYGGKHAGKNRVSRADEVPATARDPIPALASWRGGSPTLAACQAPPLPCPPTPPFQP